MCRCFHTDNIYLEDQRLHVRFETEQQFRLDYREVSVETPSEPEPQPEPEPLTFGFFPTQLLRERGCVTEHQFADVLNKVGNKPKHKR